MRKAQQIYVLLCCSFVLAIGGGTPNAEDGAADLRQELEAIRQSQKDLAKLVESQKERIQELERDAKAQKLKKIGIEPTPASYTNVPAAGADAAKAPSAGLTWKDVTNSASKFKLYGFLRLDTIYDDSAPSNTQTVAFIRSEDGKAPASIRSIKDNDDLSMYPRLTRLGLDFEGPKVSLLGDPTLTGKMEIDFYNNGLLGQAAVSPWRLIRSPSGMCGFAVQKGILHSMLEVRYFPRLGKEQP